MSITLPVYGKNGKFLGFVSMPTDCAVLNYGGAFFTLQGTSLDSLKLCYAGDCIFEQRELTTGVDPDGEASAEASRLDDKAANSAIGGPASDSGKHFAGNRGDSEEG